MIDGFLGAVIGLLASWLFYRFGRRDNTMLYRDGVITSVLMRLKEMTPTSKARVPHGYGLDDTAHWITCLAEIQQQVGWTEGAEGLLAVAASLRDAPHFPNPTPDQAEEGERRKREWDERVRRIHEPKAVNRP